MTEPTGGASEGISWIDVAASAAGITEQMRGIGVQAANAFSQSFNSRVGPELSRAMSGMSTAGTAHGQAFGQSFSQAAAGAVRGTGTQLSSALGQEMRSASGAASQSGSGLGSALGAGITKGFAEVGVGAVIAGKVAQEFTDVKRAMSATIGGFEKLGTDAGDAVMTGFTDVMAGRMPSVAQAFGLLSESVQTGLESTLASARVAIDATIGMVPALGAVVDAGLDQIDSALGGTLREVTAFGSTFTQVMVDVGDEWQEVARTIAGQTLDASAMQTDLGILRDLASSGMVANFKDIAGAVGELGQRLSGLGDGVGLSTSQLEELAKTLGLSDELLGVKVNVDALTAAFNDFNVAPEQTADELTVLTNIARMTGDNLDSLLTNVDQLGPVLQSLGYTLDETAFFAGRMNQELGPVAAARMGGSFVQMDEKLHKAGVTWQGLIDVVKAYHAAGDDAAAVDYLKGMGASARNAANFVKLINDNILATPEALRQSMDAAGDALHTPLERAVEDTRTLQDTLDQLSNQLKSAFADIGIPLVEGLNHAAEHVRDWLQENQGKIISWGNTIMQAVLTTVSTVATDFGQLLVALGPVLNTFKTMVVDFFDGILVAVQGVIKPLSLLPDWLGGDVFKAVDKGLQDSQKGLSALANTDIGPMLADAGRGLEVLGRKAHDAMGPLDALARTGRDMAAVDKAFSGRFAAKPGDQPTWQRAFTVDDQGLSLAPGSDWGQTVANLYKLGINVDFDENTGRIKAMTANTQEEADTLSDYLKEKLGPETFDKIKPKINITVQEQPPMSPDDARRKLGLPSEIEIPAIPTPAPGTYPPPAAPPTPAPGGPPPAAPPSGGGLSDLNRIPQSQGGLAPSGFHTTSTGLVGVVLPTSLNVHDPAERKTLSQLMDAVGIPTSAQGTDGVTLPVSFDVSNMPSLSMPTGLNLPGGAPGFGDAPYAVPGGGPQVRSVGAAIYNAVISAGYSPQTAAYAVAAAMHESSLNPDITNASGHHGLFQESSDKPSAGIEQQIAWFLGALAAAGGPGVVNANPANVIADQVERGGYPGSTYDQYLPQVQALLAGGGGGVPAGAGAGSANAYAANPGGDDDQGVTPEIRFVEQIAHRFGLRLTAGRSGHGTHDIDGGYHDSGEAGDFSNGMQTAAELAFARYMEANFGPELAEVIHTDPGLTQLVKDGRLVNPSFYGADTLAGHHDHVHIAVRPGAFGNLAGFNIPQTSSMPGVRLADYTTGGGGFFPADYVPGSGGGPGGYPPPPGMQPVPPGTPDAVHTPYGDFTYSWAPGSPAAGLPEEQRHRFDEWLHQQETRAEQSNNTTDDIKRAQDRLKELEGKKRQADDELRQLDDQVNKLPAAQQDARRAADDYQRAKKAADAADRAYADAQKALDDANRRAHDQDVQGHLSDEAPPPWVRRGSGREGDKDAESLGKGLVKGIFQGLGFPDVFGKPPTEWGIWKLGMGVLGFGANLLTGGGGSTAGGYGGGGVNTGAGGILGSILQGLPAAFNMPHAGATAPGWQTPTVPAWRPGAPQQQPGGAPPAPAAIPAQASSQTPAIVPAASSGAGGGASLTVNNTYQGFNPTPEAKDQIRQAAYTTSAPALSGGAGIPV